MNIRLSWLIVPFAVCFGLLFGLFSAENNQVNAATTHQAAPPITPFIALYGEDSSIAGVAAPFITNGALKPVRDYPNPNDYMFEGSLMMPGGVNTPAIRMYQVTRPPALVNNVIVNVIAAVGGASDVRHVHPNFVWLSYAPKQVIIHGPCNDTSDVFGNFNGTLEFVNEISMDYVGLPPAQQDCVGLYKVSQGVNKTVREIVTSPLATSGLARAEPNYFTSGFMGGYAIYGSPAAMEPNAPVTTTSGTTPLSTTTGVNVGVYVFDTSPYTHPLGTVAPQMIKSKMVKVFHLGGLGGALLPIHLPVNPARDFAGHGTFVATPIVDLAPETNLTLVRTLTNNALGTQYAFAKGVDAAIRNAEMVGNEWNGVVFNYSLGLEDTVTDSVKTAMKRVLDTVHQLNIVQVAAAGNESAYETMPLAMSLPAAHEHVIGVTALSPGNKLACYANSSRHPGMLSTPPIPNGFAARGGGLPRGVGVCNVDAFVQGCAAETHGGCLVGWDPTSPTNHSYAIGTSFATSHLTAFAAQLLELMGPPRAVSWTSPDQVRQEIASNATVPEAGDEDLGDGYIGAYPDGSFPTAVGLGSTEVRSIALPVSLLGATMLGFSAISLWRRYHYSANS